MSSLALRDLELRAPYAIVELSDGRQGVALNLSHEELPFYRGGGSEAAEGWRALASGFLKRWRHEPLLTGAPLAALSLKPHEAAVRVAILNALCQPSNHSAEDLRRRGLIAAEHPPPLAALTRPGDVVGVVGFRRADFRQALHDPNVHRVLVSDPFWNRSAEMRAQGEAFRGHFGEKLEFRGGAQAEAVVAEADVAVVGGAALCDGTMDGLLRAARNGRCREVIVRGHSAGILAEVLFDHGVTMHVPSSVPRGFLQEAREFMDKVRQRRGLAVLNEERTVLQESNFYDFIDLRLPPVAVRERRFSLAAVKRRLRRRAARAFWPASPGRAIAVS